MKTKSIKGTSPEEIQTSLQESMADGFKPSLAIVFISIKQDRNAICEILREQSIDIIGATSCGEFINGYQDQGSIAILLMNLQRDYYSVLFEDGTTTTIAEIAKKLSLNARQSFKKPAFILLSTGMSKKRDCF